MIKLEINLFRQAIKLPEFQEFMIFEMKITDEELEKLRGCRNCLKNFSFLERSVEKINAKLNQLLDAGKIKKSRIAETVRFDDPEKAIEYIKQLINPEAIFIAYQK